MAHKNSINKASGFYTLLSILFGILFGVFYSVVNQVGILNSAFSDKTLELIGYEVIICTFIVIITPTRILAGLNSGLFLLLANTFFYFYYFLVSGDFNLKSFLYHLSYALGAFLISLIIWQYKRSGWFAGLGAAIPLSLLSGEVIFLIILLFRHFSWLTFANILISIGFSVFFYTKIPAANSTKIKTIVFHVILTVIFLLYCMWKKGIIIFNF